MPREDRRIVFEYDEVYKALYSLSAQKGLKKPPAGEIKGVEEDPRDSANFHVKIENPLDKTAMKLDFTRDFLAAALMMYCRGLGIPLPKKARKSVMLADGNVVLRVEI